MISEEGKKKVRNQESIVLKEKKDQTHSNKAVG